MTEKEVEKLFKSKLGDRPVAFNPENWQRMEAILDKGAAPRGGYFWRSAAAILLFGAVIASLIYVNPGLPPAGQQNVASPSVNENGTLPSTGDGLPARAVKDESMEGIDPVQGEGAQSLAVEEAPMPNAPAQNGVNAKAPNKEEASASPAKETEQKQRNSTAATEPAFAESTEDVKKDSERPSLAEASYQATGPNDEEAIGLDYKNLQDLTVDYTSLEAKAPLLPAYQGDPLKKRYKPLSLFVSGGTVFSGSHANDNLGVGFNGGLGYRYYLPKGFSLETGVSYVAVNNVDIKSKSDSTFYTFGKETVETDVNNHRLEYLEIPLNIAYSINPRHQLGIGGYFSILVNVQRDIQKTTTSFKHQTEVEREEVSGYLNEFNRFDCGLGVFYRYTVNSRLKVGLHLKQGLLDITRDVSEDYQKEHTNFNSRIVLEYSLF